MELLKGGIIWIFWTERVWFPWDDGSWQTSSQSQYWVFSHCCTDSFQSVLTIQIDINLSFGWFYIFNFNEEVLNWIVIGVSEDNIPKIEEYTSISSHRKNFRISRISFFNDCINPIAEIFFEVLQVFINFPIFWHIKSRLASRADTWWDTYWLSYLRANHTSPVFPWWFQYYFL